MDYNFYAFYYCIVTGVMPEIAFEKFNLLDDTEITNKKQKITFDAIRDMYRLKLEGYTYKQIGQLYGKTDQAIHKKMKRSKYLMKKEFDIEKVFLGGA